MNERSPQPEEPLAKGDTKEQMLGPAEERSQEEPGSEGNAEGRTAGPGGESDALSRGWMTALGHGPADEDCLDRQTLVTALSDMLSAPNIETPLTLGVFGDWGSGKTSLMKLLSKELRSRFRKKFCFAWFNAWAYEKEGNKAAALAQEVLDGLVGNLGWWKREILRLQFAWRENRDKLFVSLAMSLGIVLMVLLFLPVLPYVTTEEVKSRMGDPSYIGAGLLSVLVIFEFTVRKFVEHPISVKLKTCLNLPKYGEYLGLTSMLKGHIKTLCHYALGRPDTSKAQYKRRLIVFVDDLDRCASNSICNASW